MTHCSSSDQLLSVMLPFRALYHSDSLADVWIAAATLLSRATLLHEDLEFEAISELDQSCLA